MSFTLLLHLQPLLGVIIRSRGVVLEQQLNNMAAKWHLGMNGAPLLEHLLHLTTFELTHVGLADISHLPTGPKQPIFRI